MKLRTLVAIPLSLQLFLSAACAAGAEPPAGSEASPELAQAASDLAGNAPSDPDAGSAAGSGEAAGGPVGSETNAMSAPPGDFESDSEDRGGPLDEESSADEPGVAGDGASGTIADTGAAGDAIPPGAEPIGAPRAPVRLTEPGCCTQAVWSADGQSLMFIDRPSPDAPTAIWAVDVARPGGAPTLVTEQIGYYSDGLVYRIDIAGDSTSITRRADGETWTVPAGGRPISFSPGGNQIAWQVSPQNVPSERRTSRVWISALDGSGAREVAALPRGSLVGWLGEDRLLIRGRDDLAAEEDVLWVLSLADGSRREIARSERLRGELASPDGAWVAYYVAQARDAASNGLWVVGTGGQAPRRLDPALFGAYRWRPGGGLLVVPLENTAAHRLIEVDPLDLAHRPLIDPATTAIKITNGDWSVSPDGRRLAWVEAADHAIWAMDLPAPAREAPSTR